MLHRGTVTLFLACALAACGGGGGGDGGSAEADGGGDAQQALEVTVHYSPGGMQLFTQARHVPAMNGFEGHTPFCTLVSGNVPEGTRLESDCSITGRPTRVEVAAFVVRVGAAGVSNTLDFEGQLGVFGPSVRYGTFEAPRFLRPGQVVGEFPLVSSWSAPPDVPLTWQYSVVEGGLPDGITLDPATGLVEGRPTSAGQFSARIQATLHTPFGSYRAEPAAWAATVQPEASFLYSAGSAAPLAADAVLLAWLGQPVVLFPAPVELVDSGAFTDFRLEGGGALPAGLVLDPASGEIRGTPTELAGPTTLVVSASKTAAGVRMQAPLAIEVRAPATLSYPSELMAQAGAPVELHASHTSIDFTPVGFVAVARAAGCSLPAGLEIVPTNGSIVGTTTTTGAFECAVDVTLTHGSVTWSQPASFRLVVQ